MVKNTSEYMKDTKTWLIIAIMHFTADVKLQPEKNSGLCSFNEFLSVFLRVVWLIIAIMHFTADVKLQPEKIQACVHLKTMQHDIAFLEW